QKALLSKSYITTIDAFCLSVVKQNFILCGLDPAFSIGDENELSLMEKDVLDDVFEKYYSEKEEAFLRLSETYSEKFSDLSFAQLILDTYKFIQSDAAPENWIKRQIKVYDVNETESYSFWNSVWGKYACEYISALVKDAYEELLALRDFCIQSGVQGYRKSFDSDTESIGELNRMLQKGMYEEAFSVPFKNYFSKAIGRKSSDDDETVAEILKNRRKKIKDKLTEAYEGILGTNTSPEDDIRAVSSDMKCLCRLLLDYSEALIKEKHSKRIYSFSDIAHFALKLLAEDCRDEGMGFVPTDAAQRYQKQFDEIYVDEYQDTSLMQEVILNAVSGAGCNKNNIFMVGDIKQSIYSFRQARPDIFLYKYNTYTNESAENKLICLYANFRSKGCIVNGVNSIFSKIMKYATCGMEYTEREYLNYGAVYYEDAEDLPKNEKCELITIGKKDTKSNDECDEARDTEVEARFVAAKIKSMIESGYQVYDSKTQSMRNLRPGDVAVLMRNAKEEASEYADVFAAYGISAFTETKGGFFISPEISIVLSFMKIIDNPYQDIPLMALMRSPVFDFSDNDIAFIRVKYKRCSLYSACGLFIANKNDEYEFSDEIKILKEKLRKFTERIDELRYMSGIITVYDLVWILVNENGFYQKVLQKEHGMERQANIRYLLDKAGAYDSGGGLGLFKFIRLMQRYEDENKDLGCAAVASFANDAVQIMTIHKSKGLEFPVVFLVRCSRSFSDKDKKSNFLLHRDLGLNPFCYCTNGEKRVVYPSVMVRTASGIIYKEQQAEEMRLLYVAMTRAREKFIAVGTGVDDCSESVVFDNVSSFSVLDSKSYYEWIKLAAEFSEHWNMSYVPRNEAFNWIQKISFDMPDTKNDESDKGNESHSGYDLSDCRKPLESESVKTIIPVKISVSDIKRLNSVHDEDESISNYFSEKRQVVMKKLSLPEYSMSKKRKFTSAEKGTLIHTCLECMDFKLCRGITETAKANEFVERFLNELQENGVFSREEASAVERDILVNFILSDKSKRIINAEKVYRETPFTLNVKWSEITGEPCDRKGDTFVSVQGIIDCFIEEDDGCVVIDYKTDYFGKETNSTSDKSYETQLRYYCYAIERITGKKVKESQILYLRNL
ncbi:MAG: helicase-exonuclease AddAB subunit AddA, partial [Clostridia bacterium]|nr:helicase-exonuclease AddAB subunit AddA [Clostridia bacterium]